MGSISYLLLEKSKDDELIKTEKSLYIISSFAQTTFGK